MTHKGPPEESAPLRVVVVVAVCIAVAAVTVHDAVPLWLALLSIPSLPAAALVAHRHRHGAPGWVKALAAVVVPLALVRAAGSAASLATLNEARFTLAELFVVVQVAHALDMPRRRDLYVSLGSSLVLLAVAASLSQDMRFGAFLLLWAAAALTALVLAHRSALREGTTPAVTGPAAADSRSATKALVRSVLRGVVVAAAAGALVFLVVPPPTRGGQLALPFRLGDGSGVAGGGLLRSPSGGDGDSRGNGSAYYGVSSRMDLRVRGDLPDEVVMKVQSSAPGMWRGAVFDTYDGVSWVGDEGRGRDLGAGPVFRLPDLEAADPRVNVSQTFFLEADLPSAIYGVGEPTIVYFPSGVSIDRFGLPRAEATLDDGLVYSVVSSYGAATPDQLRSAPRADEGMSTYLQLPALPARVRELAVRITAGAPTDYDRVRAIEAYLRDTYRYRLDSAVPPDGQDAVDHFLFDAREGFCEQFAAAMTVLSRSLGIASRVATGYVPGSFNALTGYYTVRGKDAHAWVEVHHPSYGWYSYDPTSSVPAARTSVLDRVPLVRMGRWLAARVADLAPAGRAVGGVAAVLVVGAVLRWWRARRRSPVDVPGFVRPAPVMARGPATAALERLDIALRAAGSPRRVWETPGELLRRARADAATGTVDREAYGGIEPGPAASGEAAAVIDAAIGRLDGVGSGSGRLGP